MPKKKAKQYNLFEEEKRHHEPEKQPRIEKPTKLNALKLNKYDTKKESRLKKLISSRLKKIETLNRLLKEDQSTLFKLKELYQQNLSQEEHKLCKDIELYTEKLLQRYNQKSFAQYQKDTLEYVIEDNFDLLYSKDYRSDTLEALVEEYNKLKEQNYGYDEDFWDEVEGDESEDNDFDDDVFTKEMADEIAKDIIKGMLEDMGLDVDEEFFEGLHPDDPDFEDKFQKRLFEYAENQESTQKAETVRKKVLTTDKEFTKLYKNLVKKIHPDLTTDEEERQRREGLMKEISQVWEQRDYYQLLILQAKIDPESNNGLELSKSHLQQIADDLLDKTRNLEQERYTLKTNPENEFYFSNFYATSDRRIQLNLENYKLKLNAEIDEVKENTTRLKNQKTTKAFLKELNEKFEDESVFDDFWY